MNKSAISCIRNSNRAWSAALTATWLTIIVLVSLLPLKLKFILHTHGRFHLLFHFAAFLVLALLAFAAARAPNKRLALCIALVGLAFVLEALQRALYPIHFEWPDFLTDSGGVLVALLLHSLWRSRILEGAYSE